MLEQLRWMATERMSCRLVKSKEGDSGGETGEVRAMERPERNGDLGLAPWATTTSAPLHPTSSHPIAPSISGHHLNVIAPMGPILDVLV